MTLFTTDNRTDQNGDNVTTSFNFNFRTLLETDLNVFVDNVLQALTTDYTVTGPLPGTGSVDFVTAPPAGTGNVIIIREVDLTQTLDLTQTEFPPEKVEETFDKVVMMVQQHEERFGRTIGFAETSPTKDKIMPEPEASKLIGWDGSGNLANFAQAELTDTVIPTAFMEAMIENDANADQVLDRLGFTPVTKAFVPASTTKAAKAAIQANAVSMVKGLFGNPNSGTPLRQYDLFSDLVGFRDAQDDFFAIQVPGKLTNDIDLAGPVPNGRDQAGAFPQPQFINFYYIWNGTTVATISSTRTPPLGPVLPSGYTHWAYATTILESGGDLLFSVTTGSSVWYDKLENVVAAGAATIETSIPLNTFVPSLALEAILRVEQVATPNGSGVVSTDLQLRITSGVIFWQTRTIASGIGTSVQQTFSSAQVYQPNVPTSYINVNTTGTGSAIIDVQGYKLPNGGE